MAFLIIIEFHILCEAPCRLRMQPYAMANIRLPSHALSFETSRSEPFFSTTNYTRSSSARLTLQELYELFMACGFLNYYRISRIVRSAPQASNATLCNGQHSTALPRVLIRNIAKRALFFSTTNYTNYTNYSWPVAFLIIIEFH